MRSKIINIGIMLLLIAYTAPYVIKVINKSEIFNPKTPVSVEKILGHKVSYQQWIKDDFSNYIEMLIKQLNC